MLLPRYLQSILIHRYSLESLFGVISILISEVIKNFSCDESLAFDGQGTGRRTSVNSKLEDSVEKNASLLLVGDS